MAEEHGLHLQQLSLRAPEDEAGPFSAQIMVVALDDWVAAKNDAEFEAVLRGAALAEREQRARQAREQVVRLHDELQGGEDSL